MNATETREPRSVREHRRGQILCPTTQLENLVPNPTGPATLIGNPDDDGQIINGLEAQFVLQRRANCPEWCTGHHPSDDDEAVCIPNFYDWVEVGSDDVTVTVSQNVGEQAKVCLFPGASDVRGVRLAVAETDKVITMLIAARRVIDPAYNPSAVLHLTEAA